MLGSVVLDLDLYKMLQKSTYLVTTAPQQNKDLTSVRTRLPNK